MFAHTEAVRLHEKALSIIAAMPAGRDRDTWELGVRFGKRQRPVGQLVAVGGSPLDEP